MNERKSLSYFIVIVHTYEQQLTSKGMSDKEMDSEWEHRQSNYQTENAHMQKCGTSQKADLSRKPSRNMQASRKKNASEYISTLNTRRKKLQEVCVDFPKPFSIAVC